MPSDFPALDDLVRRHLDGQGGVHSPMGSMARSVDLGSRLDEIVSVYAVTDDLDSRVLVLEEDAGKVIASPTTDYTLLPGDALVIVDGAAITVTLYDPTTVSTFRRVTFKLLGTGRIDFSRDIDGGSYAVTDPGQSATLSPTPGSGWLIL